jgi:hypothetical protein
MGRIVDAVAEVYTLEAARVWLGTAGNWLKKSGANEPPGRDILRWTFFGGCGSGISGGVDIRFSQAGDFEICRIRQRNAWEPVLPELHFSFDFHSG